MGESTLNCKLCYGDGWITDSMEDRRRCTDEEADRFMKRAGALGGAASGRMACPRCQPNWQPPPPTQPRYVPWWKRVWARIS